MSLDGPPPASKKPKKMKTAKYPCAFCGDQHWSGECRTVLTFAERSTLLKQHNRCLRCLSVNHLTARCPATKPCQFCRSVTHNAVLCETAFGSKKKARKTIRSMRKATAVKLNVPSSPALNSLLDESQDHDTPSTSSDRPTARMSTARLAMTYRCNNWKKWKPDLTLHTANTAQDNESGAAANDICRLDTVEDSIASAAVDPGAAGPCVLGSSHARAVWENSTATAEMTKLPHVREDLFADIERLNAIRDVIEADKKEIHRRQQSLRDREKNLANRESQLTERERKLTLQEASVLLMKVQLVEVETKLQADRTSVDAAMEDIASERIEMEVERQSWNERPLGDEKELEGQCVIVDHLRRQIDDKEEKWKLLKQQLTSTKTTLVETELQLHRARLRSEEESQRRVAAEDDARTLREHLAEARRKVTELEEALQKAKSERRTALRRLADEATKHADRQERDSLELEQLRTDNEVLTWSLEFRAQHTARLLGRATKMGVSEQQTSVPLNASISASTSIEGNAPQLTVKSEICDIDDMSGAIGTDSSTASTAQPAPNADVAAVTVSRMTELLQRYPQKLVAKYIAFVGSNIGFMDSVLLEDVVGFLKATDPTNGELSDAISAMCTDLSHGLAA